MRLSATTNRATPALVIPRFVIALPPRSLTVSLLADRTLRDSKIMAGIGSKGDPWDNAGARLALFPLHPSLL